MRFLDSIILARTKRKTRRIRTALVIIVSSLLFAVLLFAALVAAGFKNAANQVKDVGFGGRNIVSVTYEGNIAQGTTDGYDSTVNQMKDELRARKIRVTAETERDSSFASELGYRMNQAFVKSQAEANKKLEDKTREMANPRAIYRFTPLQASPYEMKYQPDPSKDDTAEEIKKRIETGISKPVAADPNKELSLYTVEQDMMRTQVYSGQTTKWQPGQPYPIFVSYSFLEKLSGKSFSGANADSKNQGYRELMTAYAGKELFYCYRNGTASEQLEQVIKYNHDAAKDNKASTNPIEVPVCGGFDQALLKKLKIITEPVEPETKPLFPPQPIPPAETIKMSFKIVGFVPSPAAYGTTDAITQILTSVGSLPAGQYPGIIPREVIDQDSRLKRFADGAIGTPNYLFADFNTRAEEIAFIEKSCRGNECTSGLNPSVRPFGNIALAFSGLMGSIAKILLVAVGVVMLIAGLMIMFTISKVIADSTKEIAVFRALGARRRDIAQIYFTYGLMLAGSSVLWAFALAGIGSYVVSHIFADSVAAGLIQATGAYNEPVNVILWGVQPVWLAAIILALATAAIIGIAVPVAANLRRKLINALREE